VLKKIFGSKFRTPKPDSYQIIGALDADSDFARMLLVACAILRENGPHGQIAGVFSSVCSRVGRRPLEQHRPSRPKRRFTLAVTGYCHCLKQIHDPSQVVPAYLAASRQRQVAMTSPWRRQYQSPFRA